MMLYGYYSLVKKDQKGYVIVIRWVDDFGRLIHYQYVDETPMKKGTKEYTIYNKLKNDEFLRISTKV